MDHATADSGGSAVILDIRRDQLHDTLLHDIKALLQPQDGAEKRLPTLLLYDEAGLKLFEDITYLDEYYLTNAEIEVLERYASQIAERIPSSSMVVELGSGNLRKVSIILRALDNAGKNVDYYALDLSRSELVRTLAAVPPGAFKHVRCYGLHGTYDDGLAWLQSKQNKDRPKCIMTLGSSIGNFPRVEAAAFLKGFAEQLSPRDMLLVGLDGCQDPDRVYHAYNDRFGVTHKFILNGLDHANRIMGKDAFEDGVWRVIGEYDVASGKHHAFVSPNKDVDIEGITVRRNERVRIEESFKYSNAQAERLWGAAGLAIGATFTDGAGAYHINMLSRPDFVFSLDPKEYAATAVPSIDDWRHLWASWDLATRKMIPEKELLTKPIKLRNCCIFYLGHIPGFADIHLTRATDGQPTDPAYFHGIFERGIDPDVDNPEKCHAHSEIPDEWPAAEDIIRYQDDVRERITNVYSNGWIEKKPILNRVLPLIFEHEVMHLETFLYMLLQSEHIVAPTHIKPDFEALAIDAQAKAVPNEWVKIPATTITLGRDDSEANVEPGHFFGWDNESPPRKANVASFETQSRPLTNADYAHYLFDHGIKGIPASWSTTGRPDSGFVETNGHSQADGFEAFISDKTVRTTYGLVPLKHALDWPVWASYDELASCAAAMGGRIPTYEEAQSIYAYVEQQRLQDLGAVPAATIPAVNGHLSNNGVHQTPPPNGSHTADEAAMRSDAERPSTFVDLTGQNVGFKNFHPVPVTGPEGLRGHGAMGGVWEWTSSPLRRHEGFEPMGLYPAYTSDFFDGKHYIVLGGSWATHPRVAGRKSVVNWYQHNYPYVWAGARLVRDI